MEKVSSYDRVDSSGAKYCDYNGNLLKYSRDGISALDEEGNILWNGSYERSEEHTSELQSTSDISYPFFCFRKKTNRT